MSLPAARLKLHGARCVCRQLCLLLNAEDVYTCCSEILIGENDVMFASHMIQTLSTILLTSSELFELRTQLKELSTEVDLSLDLQHCYFGFTAISRLALVLAYPVCAGKEAIKRV